MVLVFGKAAGPLDGRTVPGRGYWQEVLIQKEGACGGVRRGYQRGNRYESLVVLRALPMDAVLEEGLARLGQAAHFKVEKKEWNGRPYIELSSRAEPDFYQGEQAALRWHAHRCAQAVLMVRWAEGEAERRARARAFSSSMAPALM